jgi:hypothetical protein
MVQAQSEQTPKYVVDQNMTKRCQELISCAKVTVALQFTQMLRRVSTTAEAAPTAMVASKHDNNYC